MNDTIAAIATSPGQAAIAVVRMSGPGAIAIADRIFRGSIAPSEARDRSVLFGDIVDDLGNVVDQVLLIVMRAPRSMTGEDVVEISCHGGFVAPRKILSLLLDKGCRLAEPGEFSKRAFLHGKIDLIQAEAIHEIVRARNERALSLAVKQVKGGLSSKIADVEKAIIDCLVPIEAEIDFPEDEVEGVDLVWLRAEIGGIRAELARMIDAHEKSRYVSQGIDVAIVGRTNVGKSSLFNRIVGKERVIVSPQPCTTRDIVEATVNLDGITLNLFDTAGLGEPASIVDMEAVRRSIACLEQCDLAVAVFDASEGMREEDYKVLERAVAKKHVLVANKIDLVSDCSLDQFSDAVKVSALTGAGISDLMDAIVRVASSIGLSDLEFLVNERQAICLGRAFQYLGEAMESIDRKVPIDLVASDLRMALEELHELTGRDFTQEMLEEIFQRFCIGK